MPKFTNDGTWEKAQELAGISMYIRDSQLLFVNNDTNEIVGFNDAGREAIRQAITQLVQKRKRHIIKKMEEEK